MTATRRRPEQIIDTVLVDRVCCGEPGALRQCTKAEKEAVVQSLWSDGCSDLAIARKTGMNRNTVVARRQRLGLAAVTEAGRRTG